LVIEGSPRQGNTALVTDWVLAGMGRGVKVVLDRCLALLPDRP